MTECPICEGSGKVKIDNYPYIANKAMTCFVCDGKGTIAIIDMEK